MIVKFSKYAIFVWLTFCNENSLFLFTGPPEVKRSPVSQTLPKGEVVVLSCNASSALPVKITWFKNELQIGFGSQLQIRDFENDDQGDYYCKFSTALTSIYSKPALLVLKGKD